MKPRAGNKIHNGKQVPITAEILTSQLGREFYLTGITEKGYLIKFIDNDEFKNISKQQYEKLELMNLFTEYLVNESANNLIELLNEGLKPKDVYDVDLYFTLKGLIILRGVRKNEYLFNIIDFEGNTPKNFSANWRNIDHIKKELLKHFEV